MQAVVIRQSELKINFVLLLLLFEWLGEIHIKVINAISAIKPL